MTGLKAVLITMLAGGKSFKDAESLTDAMSDTLRKATGINRRFAMASANRSFPSKESIKKIRPCFESTRATQRNKSDMLGRLLKAANMRLMAQCVEYAAARLTGRTTEANAIAAAMKTVGICNVE